MRKRLRKKLFLGEFQEYLLEVEMRVDNAQISNDDFIDRWLDEVETNHMMCGGGGGANGTWSFVVGCHADLEGLQRKRANLERWLQSEASIKEFTLSPIYADLTRAFHSSPDAATRQGKVNRERGIGSKIWRD